MKIRNQSHVSLSSSPINSQKKFEEKGSTSNKNEAFPSVQTNENLSDNVKIPSQENLPKGNTLTSVNLFESVTEQETKLPPCSIGPGLPFGCQPPLVPTPPSPLPPGQQPKPEKPPQPPNNQPKPEKPPQPPNNKPPAKPPIPNPSPAPAPPPNPRIKSE